MYKRQVTKHTNSSYFTFVAIDEKGKSLKVPGLELTNKDEIRRFALGKLRKELKIADKKGYAVIIAHPNRSTLDYLEQQIPLLAEKNIVIVSGSEAIRQQRREIIGRTKETLLSKAERQADPSPLGIH